MRRREAADSEIVRRLHQAASEVVLPDPIDHHARGQRVVSASQPLSQLQPTAAGRVVWQRLASQHFDEAARDFDAGLIGLTSHLHPDVVRRPFRHAVGHRERSLGQQLVEFLLRQLRVGLK